MSFFFQWFRKFRLVQSSPERDCEMAEKVPVKQEANNQRDEDVENINLDREIANLVEGAAAIRVGDRIREGTSRASIPPEVLW